MRPLSGRRIASLEVPLPRQRTRHDIVEILMMRPPAENPPHLLGSRHDCRGVPCPPSRKFDVELAADRPLDRSDHFEHRVPGAIAAIEKPALAAITQMLEGIE